MQQIAIHHQYKKAPNLERLLICRLFLVRQVDTVWNHFEAKMYVMYEKLARLDFVMIAGEVTYIPREEVRNVWL